MNAPLANCSERFAQGFEDVIGDDDLAQAVTVQISQQRRLSVYEYQRYAAAY